MKKYYLFTLLCVTLFISCSKNTPNSINNQVVLIFNNYDPKDYKTPGGMSHKDIPLVTYIDEMGRNISFIPNPGQDTLIIGCKDNHKEIAIGYRNFEYIYYNIWKGDTIVINTDNDDYPIAESQTNQDYNRVYNLNYNLRRNRTHLGLEAKTCLGEYFFIRIAQNIDFIKSQGWNMAKDYCSIDTLQQWHASYMKDYIDSIESYKKEKLIDSILYQKMNRILTIKNLESQLQLNTDTSFYQTIEPMLSDSLITSPAYHELINIYFYYFNEQIPIIRKEQGNNHDWTQTFDRLAEKRLSPKTKQLLLAKSMENIASDFSANVVETYLNKYTLITNDTILRNKILTQYNLGAEATHLLLQNMQGNKTNIQEVINSHKGQVLYLDFWASWCAPCREEMKASKALREEFKGKDVAFIYLAYNDNEEKWKQASKIEGISDIKTNYFIENSKNSEFLENIGLNLIPRFLIIDKEGKIVELNAPRPSNNASEMINKYLNK